jgi:glutamyl-tRNA reductase
VFVACGLNHKTAPLRVREKIALPMVMQDELLNQLVSLPSIHEAAILSTCNRTEIYCDTDDPNTIIPWLAQVHQLNAELIKPHFYLHQEQDGLRHMLRVASGLDSMMVGEPQILGQMKQAYQEACRVGTIKNSLRDVFQYIFNASKRIRHISGVGNNPISIAYMAVQLISKLFKDCATLRVFLIGSGETASLVAKYLHQKGIHRFMIASRTHENAQKLAEMLTGDVIPINNIPLHLAKADIVISATACPLPFISKSLVEHALLQRKNAPMIFLDLAVPRDIEPDVAELDHAHLYNIDDLQTMIEQGMNERRTKARHAEELIEQELESYRLKHRSLRAKDAICNYRTQMQTLAQEELNRAMQKLSTGHCQLSVLTEFSERLINKLTHTPTTGLRRAALDNREGLLELTHYLFDTSLDNTAL